MFSLWKSGLKIKFSEGRTGGYVRIIHLSYMLQYSAQRYLKNNIIRVNESNNQEEHAIVYFFVLQLTKWMIEEFDRTLTVREHEYSRPYLS